MASMTTERAAGGPRGAATATAPRAGGSQMARTSGGHDGIFTVRWEDHQETFAREGWAHVPQGADPGLLGAVRAQVAGGDRTFALSGQGIAGQKDQFLFGLPDAGWAHRLFRALEVLTGLRSSAMVLSERHVKVYAPDADPAPVAHKDRLSSQIAVGIAVVVPPGSHLVLYPQDHRDVNPLLTTGLRSRMLPQAGPEHLLRGCAQVEVHDAPGDVVIFPGSSMWHLRRHAAGTVNLYLKVNVLDLDPLGEDPSTAVRRRRTLAALNAPGAELRRTVPVLSRRFESIERRQLRLGWQEVASAVVWGQPPIPLSETDALVLRSLSPGASWDDVVASVASRLPLPEVAGAEASLRRLATEGAIDLVVPSP